MGVVHFIGAGPGARGLVTVRAAELLASAAHVLHDRGLPPELLGLAAAEAVVAEVSDSPVATAERAAQLAAGAEVVVRLVAGDGVSSPGAGEEMRRLDELGTGWEVVAGVSVEAAARAYAGVVGGGPIAAVRLGEAAGPEPLLTVRAAPDAARGATELKAAGMGEDSAGVVVTAAGTASQAVTGGTLAEFAKEASAVSPGRVGGALLVGPAVASRVPWFERKPLFGRRIVVTRPRAQASGLLAWLEAQGAEPVEFPAIRIVPPPDPGPLERAAASVRSFDWLVFTSVNGVERFWRALERVGLDARALSGARVAAIGPATAAALRACGIVADVVPVRYVAESVVDALEAEGNLRGRRILLARAAGAREVLPRRLAELGAEVTEVEAYRSVADTGPAEALRERLRAGEIDVVTFTSSSTVQNFVDAVGTELGGALVACIGPVTAATAGDLGLIVQVVAANHTVAGLEAALLERFGTAG